MKRLMIYDQTTIVDGLDLKTDALAYSWALGGELYRSLRSLDKIKGVSSWNEALNWILIEGKKEPISMIQYWGHGSPGCAHIGLDVLVNNDTWDNEIKEISTYLTDDCLFWFRTCATFAGIHGQKFAKDFANKICCRVAGHTYNINFFHSGLHAVLPNESPTWSTNEGVESFIDNHYILKKSSIFAPSTIICLQANLPKNLT